MKKLSLKLDELQVETFEAEADLNARRGTVKGHWTWETCPNQWTCDGTTCGRQFTNEGTCDNTCGQPATCGYHYCGTYPNQGCPNSQWYCTNCQYYC
jgi:hypothetical protein